MKKRNHLLGIIFAIFVFLPCFGQKTDISLRRGFKKIDIPFEYENNFIILKVVFNDFLPLNFIFDTGAEHTILTKREITDLLQIDYEKRFTILGADMSSELYAYLVRGIKLKMGDFSALNRNILVLEEDYFRFEEFAGINVQGIIGSDIFRRFVVKINYARRIITLYDPKDFSPPSKYEEFPIEITRHKPYVFTNTLFQDGAIINTKLLVDTGASLALLLYTDTHPDLHIPAQTVKTNIGMGMGGFLEGFLGRVPELDMGDFKLNGVITNFQEIQPGSDTSYMNDRNGILGNQILSRFTVIIDYVRHKIYLSPLKGYSKKFAYDRSGMSLAASGDQLNVFTVFQVIENSPAIEADIRVGDELRRINGWSVRLFSLESITRKLQGRPGKIIRLVIERDEETLKKTIQLRDLI